MSSERRAKFFLVVPTAVLATAAFLFMAACNIRILAADTVILLPLIFASYMAAFKISGRAFLISVVQVFALSFFCQWLAWHQFGLTTNPAPIALAIAAAAFWGRLDRQSTLRAAEDRSKEIILAVKEKELREAHLLMVRQDETDRRILASDLHDQVLNDLKALRTLLASSVENGDNLDKLNALLDQASSQVREVMENLTPSVLENLGLISAIDDLLRRSAAAGKFKARLKNDCGNAPGKLSKIEELLLYRIIQEALNNIVKHSQATKVEITLSEKSEDGPSLIVPEREFIVAINDDGLGIAKDKVRGQSRGLRYMRQRADLIGAKIAWLPGAANKGCLVEIRILLKLNEDVDQGVNA